MCFSTSFHKLPDISASFLFQETCKINDCVYEALSKNNYYFNDFKNLQSKNFKSAFPKTTVNKLSSSLISYKNKTKDYKKINLKKNRHHNLIKT